MSFSSNSQRRRIFLIRHGAVQYVGANKKLSAHTDVQLTPKGREQAKDLRHHLSPISFNRVFSSPLARCIETATLVSGHTRENITTVPNLREVEPGHLAKLSPQILAENCLSVFENLHVEDTFLGGETFASLTSRVQAAIDEILNDRTWQACLIVAHEVVNRAILSHALSVDVATFNQLEQEECALNLLDVSDDGHFIIRLMNYMAYDPLSQGHSSRSMERLAATLNQGEQQT